MTNGFNGLRVVAFESRRAKEIEKLIAYHGGVPIVAPSMREVPLSESNEALEFAEELFQGKFDTVILLTGVGTRTLADAIATRYPREMLIDALTKVTIVARGPKPVAALREMGLTPDITVPEPNTWRDILSTIDSEFSVAGKRIAVQEYGISNSELLSALKQRGAEVKAVPVYRWALPEDIEPLKNAIRTISEEKADISLFTSSQQVNHLLQIAQSEGLEEFLRKGFNTVAIGSIGPTTTETLQGVGLAADYEPNSPKMGNLVREMARQGETLLRKKRIAYGNGVDTNKWRRFNMVWTKDTVPSTKTATYNSTFMKACRRELVDYTPIWLMRQAGRFLREYRELRAKVSFLELCKNPELAAEVTLMAVDRLAVDAAIIFADILLVLEPLGIELEFSKGDGPRINKPMRSGKALDNLREFETESLQFVYDAVSITRRALDPNVALIGFAGAPFTVASYAIEGGGSRNYENTKGLIYRDKSTWNHLMELLTEVIASYLNGQINAGADAVQIFDSWVGCLSPDDYREFVLPYMRQLIQKLKPGVPVIHFGTGTSALLELMKEGGSSTEPVLSKGEGLTTGGYVIGLDWRVDLGEAWTMLGYDVAVQGNLDPVALFAQPSEIRRRAEKILDKAAGRPGHIFNLGHGILPGTPVDHVMALVDAVHEYSSKSKG